MVTTDQHDQQLPPLNTAHHLKPGDRVILTTTRQLSEQQVAHIRETILERWPDLDVLIASGFDVHVLRDAQ